MECHDEPTVTRSSSESDCTSYPQLSEITLASDPTSSSFQSLDLMTNNFYTATTGLITDFSSGPLSPVPGGSHGDHSTEPHNPRSSPYHPSSTRTPAQTPSSSPKKAAPPASNPSSDLSIHRHPTPQRLSVLRQGGTANVLDLASLVRSARDRAQQSKEFICSPPTYNYYTSTSSLDSPPVRPSLSESIDGKPSTLGPSLEPRSALVSQSSQHIAGPAWPYCLSENKLRSYTPAELDSSPSSSVRLPSVDAQSLAELTSTRSQQPRLSSSLLDDADQEEEIESMELRASDPTSELEAIAMASCLPISMDTMRSSAGPRKRKPQRSKSQGGGLYAFWAGGPPETVPGSSVDSCAATHSSLPPVTRARPRACSGPSPSDPQLVSSSAVPVSLSPLPTASVSVSVSVSFSFSSLPLFSLSACLVTLSHVCWPLLYAHMHLCSPNEQSSAPRPMLLSCFNMLNAVGVRRGCIGWLAFMGRTYPPCPSPWKPP